ncbi:MAG: anti-sigma factor [Calditrichaceae bacterium]
MNCKIVQSKIPEYMDRNLSDTLMTDIANHLNTCEKCTRVFAEFRLLWEKTEQPDAVIPSEGFSDRVIDKIYSPSHESGYDRLKHTGLRWFYPVAAAATIIAGIFIGYKLGDIPSPAGQIDDRYIAIQSFVDSHYLTDLSLIPGNTPGEYSLNSVSE